MKKYLLGTMAIILAIGLNSFTLKETILKSSGKSALNKFWYRVGSDGKVTAKVGQVLRSSVVNTNCPDGSGIVCAKGYDSDPNLQIGDPAPDTNTDAIKKS